VTPLLTVALLFWSMLVFAVLALAWDERSRQIFRSSWRAIVVIVVATALWRTPWDGVFFHGLEYEDSYVYTVAGRQLAERVSPPPSDPAPPFSFSVCAMGSVSNCQVWEPFPEHLIGYPYVIGVASRIVGYSPSIGSLINLGASLISAVLVFMLALTIAGDTLTALFAGLAFAVIPVFAVYGLETSAEPFSCCCMLLMLWFYVSLWSTKHASVAVQTFQWCAYTCALLFCQTIKREDVLLALVLPIVIPIVMPRMTGTFSRRLLVGFVVMSSVLALILSFKMHLLETSENEQQLLRQFPLTTARLTGFIGSFLSSFGVLRWYEGTFLAVLAGVIIASRKRGVAIIPVVLLGAFIVLYASHIRGYYEMESGRVSPESALRFSMNLMGLWAIVAGIGLGGVTRYIQYLSTRPRGRLLEYSLVFTGIAFLLVSFVGTIYLRRDAVEDETNSRVTPAAVAAEASAVDVSHDAYILTMDPLVVQMYSDSSTRIVDLESVDGEMLDALISSQAKLVLLKQNDRFMEADLARYGEPFRRVLALPSRRLDGGEGFTVSLIQPVKDSSAGTKPDPQVSR
jgi:hypothetical protein